LYSIKDLLPINAIAVIITKFIYSFVAAKLQMLDLAFCSANDSCEIENRI
jgi:hypothetical protein